MDLSIDQLRLAAKQYRRKSPRTVERLLALIELSKRMTSKRALRELDYERVAAEFGKSARSVHRWKRAWEERGVKGVVPRVSPGRRKRPISGFIAKKIREFRKKYRWGAEVIHAHLKYDFGLEISEDRIHRFLLHKGLVDSRRKRKPRSKHTRVVKVTRPGVHTQNDVKHLPHILPNEQKSYVYNFVDHASRWEFKRAYDSLGPGETKDFAERVIKKAPFTIWRWQTDNGIEFTFKYVSHVDKPKKHALDKLCEKNGIRHVLIPPGEKELQGLVERSHRMDEDELYHRIKPRNLDELNRFLEAHCEWKNNRRRRKSLGWKTPNEWLKDHGEKILSGLVRPTERQNSIAPVPNEGLSRQDGWERSLLEIWSHVARQNGSKATTQLRPGQTRQNFFLEDKQEDETRSVGELKKAA
jgi:transposase InsO family protein